MDISVVVSTYNRADVLPRALGSLREQVAPGLRYEIIVVDNNSSDSTRVVVKSFMDRGGANMRYLFEPRQGLAYGRNTGIEASNGSIIAFTDDDVMVAPNWIATLKRVFDEHPEADCVGGRVLPRWDRTVPLWLTREHWAPLALLDYGDTPFYVTASRPLCLVGANTAFRRAVFSRIGLLAPYVQAYKRAVGTEDHELLLRLWRSGGQGWYEPTLLVTSDIASDRITKEYHRQWHRRHGRSMALMRAESFEQTRVARVLGVPGWIYREAIERAIRCIGCLLRGDGARAFLHEARLRFCWGFLVTRWGQFLSRVSAPDSMSRAAPAFTRQQRAGREGADDAHPGGE